MAALLSLVLGGSPALPAADGDLDKTFNKTGKVVLAASDESLSARGLAVQADGKILALAERVTTSGDVYLARLLSNGAADPSFGAGGVVGTDVDGGRESPYAVRLQPDRRIVVGGSRELPFEEDGSEDGSNLSDFLFLRYTTAGKLDPSFGGGKGYVRLDSGLDDLILALAVQKDRKIVGAGSALGADDLYRLALVRLLANGQPDSSFGGDGNGRVVTLIAGEQAIAYDVLVMQDGRILVAGEIGDPAVGNLRGLVVRFLADGDLDPSFGDGGVLVLEEPGMYSGVGGFVLQRNGRLVVWANLLSKADLSKSSVGVYRLQGDGARDPRFGANGLAIVDFTPQNDLGAGLVAALSGKLILAGSAGVLGSSASKVALARLLPDGRRDSGFAKKGQKLFPLDARGCGAVGLALQKDGKILVASRLRGRNAAEMAVTRHLAKPN